MAVLLALAGCGSPTSLEHPESLPPEPVSKRTQTEAAARPEKRGNAIATAMQERKQAVQACWERGAADNFNLSGNVVISLRVEQDGRPADVRVASDTTDDRRLTNCLRELWSNHRWPAGFAVGKTIELPLEFTAPEARYKISRAHALVDTFPDKRSTVHLLFDRMNSGNGAAGLTFMRMKPGLSVPMHRHTSTELFYIIAGAGDVFDLRGPEQGSITGHTGDAVFIAPGTAHGFRLLGPADVTALQLVTPAGPEQRFKGLPSAATTPVYRKKGARLPRRFSKPELRSLSKARSYKIADGKGDVAILFDGRSGGDGSASVCVITAQPGMKVAPHSYKKSSEYLYIIDGEGTVTIEGEVLQLRKGDALQVPPGVKHSFSVRGDRPAKVVQFFTPSGPEQQYKR